MLSEKDLHPYQDHIVEHILEHPAAAIFVEMGLGKTVATLTAIDRLIYDSLQVKRVLVVAPKRVADEVWTEEVEKWDHLRHLQISKVLGDAGQRKRALLAKADIYVINRENVPWLVTHYSGNLPFDMWVIDESSSFKDPKTARFKALRQVRPRVSRVVILTGTPTPNGLLNLWPQLYLLDMGERLGKTIGSYREKYFKEGHKNGHIVYSYSLRKEEDPLIGRDIYQQEIYDKISDICISMKAKDYLTLPERIDRDVIVNLSAETRAKYDKFEEEQVLALQDAEISAVNAVSLTGKLLQFSNGAVYDADKNYHCVHDEKLEALEEIVEAANGEPVFIFFNFRHDKERIKKYLSKYKPVDFSTVEQWNKREDLVTLAHPASAGHGLNLQRGGHIIIWFGLPNWSSELYQQGVTRFDRQGQKMPVLNYRILAAGTMDMDMARSITAKGDSQEILMNAVKARIKKYARV